MTANTLTSRTTYPDLPPGAPRMSLSVAAGEESIRCQSGTPVVLIGSRRDCHLPLAHPDVSKLHCAVVNTGKAILVRDLLSRSGTFVNDELVQTALLRPGDTVQVGPVQVNVEFSDAAGAPPPAADPDGADLLRFATPVVLDKGGKRIEITHNVTVIGRRKSADVVIDTPDVSLAHVLVFMLDGHPVVCDLGSRSGTFRNGERVELAWLNDGDELGIGGEKLTVRWTGAMLAMARPAEVPELADAEDQSELELTIATVQTQVSATWTQIEERKLQLDQREAELESQFAQLARRYDALAQAEAALQRRETDAKAAEAQARENLASTGQCEQSLTRERAELDKLAKHLTNQRKAQEAQQAELAAQQARLDDANTALARQRNELVEQIEACSRGEKELQQRAKEMDQRDAALRAREASAPTQTAAASGDDLPAPMVQQPLFAPGKSQPPSDWPAELHKRFRVLRRVSSKTNEELLAQIWAEREKIRASQASEDPRGGKKR